MKNMKKLVALFAATTMAMSLSVSAFAASYADGTLTLEAADFTDTGAQKTMMAYVVDGTTDAEGNAFTASTIPAYNAENHAMIALNQDASLVGAVPVDASKVAAGKTIVIKTSGSNGSLNTILLPQAAAVTTYNVTYANVTDASYPTTVEAGTTLATLLNGLATPTLEGSTFSHWSDAADGDEFTDEELAAEITADVTLYAVFTANVVDTIKVTFMNGAEKVDEVAIADGKAVITATIPTLTASADYATKTYTFVEWVTEDGTAVTAETPVEANMTVYAKFKSNLIYGDVTGDGVINAQDRTFIHAYISSNGQSKLQQTGKSVSEYLAATVIAGNVTNDTVINAQDRTFVHAYISSNGASKLQLTSQEYYVINK